MRLAPAELGDFKQHPRPGVGEELHGRGEAGFGGERVGPEYAAPLGATYCNMRKASIYGGSNEIQKNIMTQMILGL